MPNFYIVADVTPTSMKRPDALLAAGRPIRVFRTFFPDYYIASSSGRAGTLLLKGSAGPPNCDLCLGWEWKKQDGRGFGVSRIKCNRWADRTRNAGREIFVSGR